MLRKLCSALFLTAALSAQVPANLPAFSTYLASGSTVKQVATDGKGFIYVYGETNIPANGYPHDVFVSRLDPNAANLLWTVDLGGESAITRASALAVDAAGNAYVTGWTDSTLFPNAPDGPGPTSPSVNLPFVVKLSAAGSVVYSSLFSNGVSAFPEAIAVDASGDVVVSGSANGTAFPSTPGAYNNPWFVQPPFVTKLDPTGTKLIFSVIGVGGSALALDSQGNIFIAGTTAAPANPGEPLYPTTPGAYQTTYTPFVYCAAFLCQIGFPAGNQYVTKLSADGSHLIFSTFVTGSLGSYNAGMAVDSAGDVWLTGDTASTDYPYTLAANSTSLSQTFTTELDPTGSKVLLSVPLGVPPGIGNNLALDPQGNPIEVGYFPILPSDTYPRGVVPAPAPPSPSGVPSECLSNQGIYAQRISAQDGSLLASRILPGNYQAGSTVDSQGNLYIVGSTGLPTIPLAPSVYYDTAVTQRTVSGGFLERTNFALPMSALGCVNDATNATPLGPVAPGQLIALYGNGIGPAQPVVGLGGGGPSVPTSLAGVTVTFDGQPAPILYASSTQVNVQTPFELTRNPYSSTQNTVMQLTYNGSLLATRSFAVTPINPELFVASAVSNLVCGEIQAGGTTLVALALNEDGTVNSCANPASSGSSITLFVNGLGTSAYNDHTGMLTVKPQYVDASAALWNGGYSLEVDAFTDQAGALSGVGQITARVPYTVLALQPMAVTLTMSDLPVGPLAPFNGAGPTGNQTPVVVFVKP